MPIAINSHRADVVCVRSVSSLELKLESLANHEVEAMPDGMCLTLNGSEKFLAK